MAVVIDDFVIDAVVEESHEYESEVTSYPIESGSDITDHVRIKPITFTLTNAIVSDTPIGGIKLIREDFNGDPAALGLSKLLEIRDARKPITVSTALRDYDNCIMTNLTIPKNMETDGGLFFTATFTQIQLVTNLRTTVRVASPNGGKKGSFKLSATTLTELIDVKHNELNNHLFAVGDPPNRKYFYANGTPVPYDIAKEAQRDSWRNKTRTTQNPTGNDLNKDAELAPWYSDGGGAWPKWE